MIKGIVYAFLLGVLLVISVLDAKDKVINSKALIILLLGGIAAILLNEDLTIINGICAMLLVFVLLWIIHCLSKGSIGKGDVKLCAVTALYLGIERAFNMLLLSTLMCGITAVILLIVNKTYKNKSLPFTPFVTAGTIAALLLQYFEG